MEPTIQGEYLLLFKLALLLFALSFKVRRCCLTLRCHAELRVDHETVTELSQFCLRAMSNSILSSLQLLLWRLAGGGGGAWERGGKGGGAVSR